MPNPDLCEVKKRLLAAVHEFIVAHPEGLSSGQLYATLQGLLPGYDLDAHNAVVQGLTRDGRITASNHWLKAVGS